MALGGTVAASAAVPLDHGLSFLRHLRQTATWAADALATTCSICSFEKFFAAQRMTVHEYAHTSVAWAGWTSSRSTMTTAARRKARTTQPPRRTDDTTCIV